MYGELKLTVLTFKPLLEVLNDLFDRSSGSFNTRFLSGQMLDERGMRDQAAVRHWAVALTACPDDRCDTEG